MREDEEKCMRECQVSRQKKEEELREEMEKAVKRVKEQNEVAATRSNYVSLLVLTLTSCSGGAEYSEG
jgi:uncharacterized membrane protein YcgQ (UPF0703/DUF1980 family)